MVVSTVVVGVVVSTEVVVGARVVVVAGAEIVNVSRRVARLTPPLDVNSTSTTHEPSDANVKVLVEDSTVHPVDPASCTA